MRNRILTAGLILLLTAALSGCGETTGEKPAVSSTAAESTEVSPDTKESSQGSTEETTWEMETAGNSESETETETKTEIESVAETETETENETETETETETEASVPDRSADQMVSFGRWMKKDIAAINDATLRTEGSGLFDVLADHVFTGEQVLRMIDSYSLPSKALYGGQPVTETMQSELLAYLGKEQMAADSVLPIRYGIVTDNASVRSFPTHMTAVDSMDPNEFDYFQESMFNIGTGVLVLHQTTDQVWSFVQGDNYYGWIETEKIGFTEEDTFRSFLTGEEFMVCIDPKLSLNDKVLRIGTILTVTKDKKKVIFPERAEDGTLTTKEVSLAEANEGSQYTIGFSEFSVGALNEIMTRMLGIPYGWGDTNENYDCSSMTGLSYRCFGIYTPRNTSAMKCFGGGSDAGHVLAVEGMNASEKAELIRKHPGSILIMPGHAMMYMEASGEKGMVLVHSTTGYFDENLNRLNLYQIVTSDLLKMYKGDGTPYIDAISYILFIQ